MPRRLLDAGTNGFLGTGRAAEELLRAVGNVSRGKRNFGNDLQKRTLGSSIEQASPFEAPSSRELKIAELLCQGLLLDDIAKRLGLSPKTIAADKTTVSTR